MERVTDLREMQRWAETRRAAGRRIVLVPTMGALHEGHVALVRRAGELANDVVVSIFVNPTQFDRRDDFETYPRDAERDAALLAGMGVAVLFTPEPGVMYPDGFQTHVEVERLTAGLCGQRRPGHFRGVATVVAKLFNLVRPHVAVFGEKDYQQLAAIRRMVADLDFGIDVVGVQTVRERDGLALSSRNQRLSPAERMAARCVPRGLRAAIDRAAHGERSPAALLVALRREIDAEPLARLEYAEFLHPDTLEPVENLDGAARVAVAVWIGNVRLIDNCPIGPAGRSAIAHNGHGAGKSGTACCVPVAEERPAIQRRGAAMTDATAGGTTR